MSVRAQVSGSVLATPDCRWGKEQFSSGPTKMLHRQRQTKVTCSKSTTSVTNGDQDALKGFLVTSQQQTAGSNSPGLENLPGQLWTASCPQLSLPGKWFLQMLNWLWVVHQLLWIAAQDGMAGGYCLAEVFHTLKDVIVSLDKEEIAWGAFSS